MAELPVDLISSILCRLPVKTLLQLKCVCKSWQTLISSPNFTSLHLHHSVSSNTNRLLILTPPPPSSSLFAASLDSLHSPSTTAPLRLPRNSRHSVVGSCNGLLCLVNPAFEVTVFNPSTRHHKLLNSLPEETMTMMTEEEPSSELLFGFGYDSVNEDYKVVSIVEYTAYDYSREIHGRRRRTMVYSLKDDVSWRVVSDDLCGSLVSFNNGKPGVLVGPHTHLLHFQTMRLGGFGCGIECFDVIEEKWREELPLFRAGQLRDIGVLDGCLCVLLLDTDFESGLCSYSAWVWKEYGVANSWVKLLGKCHVFDSNATNRLPIAWCKERGEVLMRKLYSNQLFWYNLSEETVRDVELQGEEVMYYATVVCWGSLVNVPGGVYIDHEEKDLGRKEDSES